MLSMAHPCKHCQVIWTPKSFMLRQPSVLTASLCLAAVGMDWCMYGTQKMGARCLCWMGIIRALSSASNSIPSTWWWQPPVQIWYGGISAIKIVVNCIWTCLDFKSYVFPFCSHFGYPKDTMIRRLLWQLWFDRLLRYLWKPIMSVSQIFWHYKYTDTDSTVIVQQFIYEFILRRI